MKVSIIGAAGTVGSCTLFRIASQGIVDELVAIDLNRNLLTCHVMDIATAISNEQNTVVRSGDYEDLVGSDVVIITASVPYRPITSRMELLNVNLPIIQDTSIKIQRYCPNTIVITVTNPIDPLNYAMYLSSGLDRKRLIGYSLNDSIRFQMMVAKALGIQSTKVEGIAIGEHGEHQVLLFSSVRVNSQPITVSGYIRRNIQQEVKNILHSYESLGTGRTSGWTSAIGLTAIISAIANDTRQVFPCSVVLSGEYDCEGMSMCVPVTLGRAGVRSILVYDLSSDEQQGLNRAVSILKASAQSVEDFLGQY